MVLVLISFVLSFADARIITRIISVPPLIISVPPLFCDAALALTP